MSIYLACFVSPALLYFVAFLVCNGMGLGVEGLNHSDRASACLGRENHQRHLIIIPLLKDTLAGGQGL
jgi:hypothetical protein